MLIDSIQPVLTKVKQPTEEEDEFDMDQIRYFVEEQFMNEIQNLRDNRADLKTKVEDFIDENDQNDNGQVNSSQIQIENVEIKIEDEDHKIEEGKLNELAKFYSGFANKLQAFDPLDRPVYDL